MSVHRDHHGPDNIDDSGFYIGHSFDDVSISSKAPKVGRALAQEEDRHRRQLAIVYLASSGVKPSLAADKLGLSLPTYRESLKRTRRAFAARLQVNQYVVSAIFHPRSPGLRPPEGFFPKYSTAAVSLESACLLDAWEAAAVSVLEAEEEMTLADPFADIRQHLAIDRSRQADHDLPAAEVLLVEDDGFRIGGHMVGHLERLLVEIEVDGADALKEMVLLTIELIDDVNDPLSDLRFCSGTTVALEVTQRMKPALQRFSSAIRSTRSDGYGCYKVNLVATGEGAIDVQVLDRVD